MVKIVLNEYLKNKKVTKYRLSKMSQIEPATLNNLAKNKTQGIKFDTLDRICKALNCEISDILVFEDEPKKS
jgi:putative transcriptional regulator